MKLALKIGLRCFICMFLLACKAKAQEKVVAEKNGYKLTETHINIAITTAEKIGEVTLSVKEKKELKTQLITDFYNQPKEIIKGFEEVAAYLKTTETSTATKQPKVKKQKITTKISSLAFGHKEIRKLLGTDIGEMNFHSKKAAKFRAYVGKSILYVNNNQNYDGGAGSGYRNSKGKMQLCANGTFVEITSGSISVDVEGASAFSNSTTKVNGYWDVATLPSGVLIILTYSTHEFWTSESPSGFLPLPIKSYTATYLVGLEGDIPYYREEATCN